MTLNPWRLRLLADLATYGTVRAVAQRGNHSPSAVSQQLATLERETRTALIERTGRRVRLTAAGVLLAGRAREILAAMEAAEVALRGLALEPAGTVRLGAFQSALPGLASQAVSSLAARHPDVTVVLLEMEPHVSMPALRRGEVDVIITTTDFAGTELDPAIDLMPLAEDEVVVVLPPGHPLADRDAIDLESCADQRWTFDVAGSYMSELATRLCREAGFEPTVICRFNNYMIALQHVERGRSITMLPSLAVDPRYGAVTRPLTPPVTRRITAAARRPSTPRPEITAVLAALRNQ
ncbi:LysR family transcriptional regulator [Paractinoplanes brasiliensis]|uniref:DNA-binding transcriptional LysR family regulator n=1 Tax=Paractinoplanes brasiliensis TaxID=52695 RepID=A0A4R6JYP7_9ACTN|nr:LysR family transcriptional regulator [Actinoplanes brasiliensis]TDO39905.1 DNA-binding transcriptional LysR family regulator [Actinoplanes brasiliensis]GID31525.1 LysR family transcriptional regulator [Actinoplanes brasiliensis]